MELNDIFGGDMLVLWQVLAGVVGTGLALVLVALCLKYLAKYAGDIRGYVKRYRTGVIEQVDDVNDPLIKRLAKLFRVPESVLIVLLPTVLNALADGLLAGLPEEQRAQPNALRASPFAELRVAEAWTGLTESDVRNIAQAEALKVVRSETPERDVNIGGAVPK
jgi:RNAse (barnase) inhibitor barstar